MGLKPTLVFLGGLALTLTMSMLVLLMINPNSRYERDHPGTPLRLYLDTSISFADYENEVVDFLDSLSDTWPFDIEIHPFAYDVGAPVTLANNPQDTLDTLKTFERQTHYQSLAETLQFTPTDQPHIILSDFIFSDFFAPQPQSQRFFLKLPSVSQTNADSRLPVGVFIENHSRDYRPSLLPASENALSPTPSGAGSGVRQDYTFNLRLTLYHENPPAQAELTVETLAPTKKILYRQVRSVSNRFETIVLPISVPAAPVLTLQATWRTRDANASGSKVLSSSDSLNLLADQETIPVAFFIFKPYKDASLIKRTLKRYGLFSLQSYTFLRKDDERMSTLRQVYREAQQQWKTLGDQRNEPIVIVMGADEEELAFFRGQKETFIHLPQIKAQASDNEPLRVDHLRLDQDFLNLTGDRNASAELWQAAAPFLRTLSRSDGVNVAANTKKNNRRQYFHQNADQSSFLFREGNEMYVGINAFYELNRSLIASANFSDADVFWVRLLEYLNETGTNRAQKNYSHNYFLGEPVEDPGLVRLLDKLLPRDNAPALIPPYLDAAGIYRLPNQYYHYRVDFREYLPRYAFDPELFISPPALIEAIANLAGDYEKEKIVTTRQLRSYTLPYILLLSFFLFYLLMKGIYSRL